jgi:dihydrofolate reductase
MINIIVATSENNVIGRGNDIPWYIPEDLEHFKKLTTGNTVIMGRKTYESLPKEYRPLPNRVNIVITRDKNYQAKGCLVVNNLEDALRKADNNREIFIIGGGQIYREGLKFADRIYLTKIHKNISGDTYFPKLNKFWKLVDEEEKSGFSFLTYVYDN